MKFSLKSFAAGLVAALLTFTGLALATNGNSNYFGFNSLTGVVGIPGFNQSLGTSPTVTVSGSSCAISATLGGATAGTFAQSSGGTSCTFTITFPTAAAAPNGWYCATNDITTPGDTVKAASTTTTTWVSGASTVGASDVIQFNCIGY